MEIISTSPPPANAPRSPLEIVTWPGTKLQDLLRIPTRDYFDPTPIVLSAAIYAALWWVLFSGKK